jgi:hypothetical protein
MYLRYRRQLVSSIILNQQNYEAEVKDHKSVDVDKVRKLFSIYLGKASSWSSEIWREKR